MAQLTAAGSKVHISTTSNGAASDAATFAALTYAEIGEITNIGEFGKTYQDISTNTINQRQTKHGKGAYDQGSLDLQVYYDPDDAGQTVVMTALDSDDEYAFKVELNDGTLFYFRGLVMSYRRVVSEVNSMVTARVGIAINTDPVEVAAV